MDDDLNTAAALGALFGFVKEVNTALDDGSLDAAGAAAAAAALRGADGVLGVLPRQGEASRPRSRRRSPRARPPASAATSPRPTGSARSSPSKGIVLEDGPAGTRWKRV